MKIRLALLSTVILASSLAFAAPSEAAGAKLPPLGVLAGSESKVASYEAWLGRDVTHVTAFVGGGTWANMEQQAGWASGSWRGSSRTAVYSVEMLPSDATITKGNAGSYDEYWRAIASRISQNDPDGIIRLGWEANGPWFDWAWGDNPTGYRDYFRRIVGIFRSMPNQNFQFMWDVAKRVPEVDVAAYPGDAYVDIVGLSFYDRSSWVKEADPVERWERMSSTYGTSLRWLDEFTAAHNKKIGFAEWSVTTNHYTGVDPDNTLFIQNFYDWLVARSDRVAFANYFESAQNSQGYFGLSNSDTPFKKSAALFKQLFGNAPSVPSSTATTAKPTPTTAKPTPTTAKPTPTTAKPTVTTAKPTPTTAKPTPTTAKPTPTTAKPTPTTPSAGLDHPIGRVCAPAAQRSTGSTNSGYWVLRSDGRVDAVGVPFLGDIRNSGTAAVSIEATSSGAGYWILAADGRVHPFGDAVSHGDLSAVPLAAPARGVASPATDGGYWVVGSDGGVFAFGLPFLGSMGGIDLEAPVISIAANRTGDGYWLVGSDGGVFAFGRALFAGSTGGWDLAAPVVAMAVPSSETGYWLYAADGGVFAFGVPFHGSIPEHEGCGQPNAVHLEPTASGDGYWVVDQQGLVYAFGDAPQVGHAYDAASPVVGFAAG